MDDIPDEDSYVQSFLTYLAEYCLISCEVQTCQ